MTADNIPRTTICFSKDSEIIQAVDRIRGNMSRSKAFRLMIQYQIEAGDAYVKDILGIKQTP